MEMIPDMGHMLLALLLVGTPRPSTSDCGAAMHKAEIADSARSVRKAVPVEALSGEFPTKDGTYECARVSFLLTPWGSMYRLRFDESTENLAFDMAVRRAIEKYEFEGSVLGMFDTKTLILDGIYNRRSPDWEVHCAAGQCDPP
jgi:hypothetical protein